MAHSTGTTAQAQAVDSIVIRSNLYKKYELLYIAQQAEQTQQRAQA